MTKRHPLFQVAHTWKHWMSAVQNLRVGVHSLTARKKVDFYVITGAGLFPIIDACTRLDKIDLTSCRGISVGDRRQFFQVGCKWGNSYVILFQ